MGEDCDKGAEEADAVCRYCVDVTSKSCREGNWSVIRREEKEGRGKL